MDLQYAYTASKNLHLNPKVVFEVGINIPESCQSQWFIKDGLSVTLFEPLPDKFKKITKYFKEFENVTSFEVAIGDKTGKENLIIPEHADPSSFLEGLESPFVMNNNYGGMKTLPPLEVNVERISKYDQGNIDILIIDTEGAEWFVIKHLISRPKLIILEWDAPWVKYYNKFIPEIQEWMENNGYVKYGRNEADICFRLRKLHDQ